MSEEIVEKVKKLVAEGYIQLSRRYRTLGRLPPGKTGLEALAEVDPILAKRFLDNANESAMNQFLRCYKAAEPFQLELSIEEFDEYLRQTGRRPGAIPYKPEE